MTDIIIQILITFAVILLSMTLHEAMHAFVSYWLGDDTAKNEGRLTLNPIKHIDPFLTILLPLGLMLLGGPIFGGAKPVPFRPDKVKWGDWGAALVAIGGPMTNLFLAFIGYGIWAIAGLAGTGGLLSDILILFVHVNLGFFIFNILPIPPLDGSRVLYALAPEFVRTGMRAIENFGIIFVFIIVILASSLISTYMVTVIDFFINVFSYIFHVV